RSVGRQRQQIASDIEGSRSQSTVISFLLQLRWLRRDLRQVSEHRFRRLFVLSEKRLDRLPIESRCSFIRSEVRCVIAALVKVLIARRSFLPIPTLLVSHLNRCQDRKPLDRQRDVRQVRN